MTINVPSTPTALAKSRRALSFSAGLWFACATLGQWAFVLYILGFFGVRTLHGDLMALNAKPHIDGYVPGDTLGNTQFLLHVLIAAVVTFAGVLQVIPALRRRWPAFHRWNGRVFMLTGLVATLTGFYLTWGRGSQLGPASAFSTTFNGVLILIFIALAWRSAWLRDLASHHRHALRAYLLVNGVWFLRIGMMLAGISLSALGLSKQYGQAAFLVVSYASWLVPVLLLQLYFRAQTSTRPWFIVAVAGFLVLLALLTLAGSAAAALFMWWPRA